MVMMSPNKQESDWQGLDSYLKRDLLGEEIELTIAWPHETST